MAKLNLAIGVLPRVHHDRSRFKEEGDYSCTLTMLLSNHNSVMLKRASLLSEQIYFFANSMLPKQDLPVSRQKTVPYQPLRNSV